MTPSSFESQRGRDGGNGRAVREAEARPADTGSRGKRYSDGGKASPGLATPPVMAWHSA